MEAIKRSVVAMGDEQVEHRIFLEQRKYSVWYYDDRWMSLYIRPNPLNIQHQE